MYYNVELYKLIRTGSSELKRKLEESFGPEDIKRKRIEGDVSSDLVTNIVSTITEPEQMVGPDVSILVYVNINMYY